MYTIPNVNPKLLNQVSLGMGTAISSLRCYHEFFLCGMRVTMASLAHVTMSSLLGNCHRPSGPKPEIQHDQRGRGVPTLTWEEVTIGEGKRRWYSFTKKEIMRILHDPIHPSAHSELAHSQCQKVGVGTLPTPEKNPYHVLDFYVQDWRWMGGIFNSYPCDLVSLYWFLSGNIFLIQDFLPDEMVNLWIFTLGLTSAGCWPHMPSIWPLVRRANVRYISTFVRYISRQLSTLAPTNEESAWAQWGKKPCWWKNQLSIECLSHDMCG